MSETARYAAVHKLHHTWTAPISIVAIYCHPFEHLAPSSQSWELLLMAYEPPLSPTKNLPYRDDSLLFFFFWGGGVLKSWELGN